ncbi:prenyltransferase/squalene oxidase repeat-containing protein [Cohnella algarum]|uniref:prenyltransferase/squalene oxidase repeat-containing protein n=1 Tax=Cohnella algarum TaxID=2044859 RepID=UPI003B83238B
MDVIFRRQHYYTNTPSFFINSSNFDNLSNIYYTLSILNYQKDELEDDFKKAIFNYLESLQSNIGNFGFSIIDRENIDREKNGGKETYLSTYYAIESYHLLGMEMKDSTKYKLMNWFKSKLEDDAFWREINFSGIGHFYIFLKSAKAVNFDLTNYNQKIKQKISGSIAEMKQSYDTEEITMLDINSLSHLGADYKLNLTDIFNPAFFKDYVLEDGGYSLFKDEENSHILATNLALEAQVINGIRIQELSNYDDLVNTLDNFGSASFCNL